MGLLGTPGGIDDQVLKIEDRVAQIERLIRRLPTSGQLLEFMQIIENAINPTVVHQVGVDAGWGPTSASAELVVATLNIPSIPYATVQYPAGHLTYQGSIGGDIFDVRLREDDITGTVLGFGKGEWPNDQDRGTVALVYADEIPVAAASPKTYVLTIDRLLGTGTATGTSETGATGIRAICVPNVP